MSSLTNQDVVEVFDKYIDDLFNNVIERAKQKGYSIGELDRKGLLEEMVILMANNTDFMDEVIAGMEDSIGVEEWGFIVDENS